MSTGRGGLTAEEGNAGREAAIKKKREKVSVELQVKDTSHALSEEVLTYCINELRNGSTWNALRQRLGLGHAGVDIRWRELKNALTEAVLPESEEEAFLAMQESVVSTTGRLEALMTYLQNRLEDQAGTKNEPGLAKAALDSIKLHMEAQQKRFEHFLRMRELKLTDRKKHGVSIIYNNVNFIPRPGDKIEFQDGRPVLKQARDVEPADE